MMKKGCLLGCSATLALAMAAFAQGSDTCAGAGAAVVGGNAYDINAGTTNSGVALATCRIGGAANTRDIFWTFTPATTETFNMTTCGNAITGSSDTIMTVYDDGCGLASEIACNDDDAAACGTGLQPNLDVALAASVQYTVRLALWSTSATTVSSGTLTITAGSPPPPPGPANDECVNATVATVGSQAYDTTGATGSGEMTCAAGSSNTVWFSFQPPADGAYDFATCGSFGDSAIAVFDACGGTQLACNDDFCGLLSTASVPGLSSASTYYVMIGNYGSGSGSNGTLTITGGAPAPANDECAGATVATDGSNAFSTAGATPGGDVASCRVGGPLATDDVWFSYTATGTLRNFSTCGGGDTQLTLLDACGGVELGCDDDSCATPTIFSSSMTVNGLAVGTTYIIRLGEWAASPGGVLSGDLFISEPSPPPANDDCTTALPASVGSTAFDTNGATGSFEASCGGNNGVWFDFQPPADDNYLIDTCGSTGDTILAVFDAAAAPSWPATTTPAACRAPSPRSA